MQIGIESDAFLLTIGGLFVFGCLYAGLIYWMRQKNVLDPFTSFMVVFGVLVTLFFNKHIHHIDPTIDFILEIACFGASGLPMIAGSMFTWIKAIEHDGIMETTAFDQMQEGSNGQA